MLGQTYYHETIRKYVAVFGTLFNDINIRKPDYKLNLANNNPSEFLSKLIPKNME